MNMVLWILQVLLALHTLMGAVWKFGNGTDTVPTLAAIPSAAWMALSIFEIIFALCLVIPAMKESLGYLVPIGAAAIGSVMMLFIAIHLAGGSTEVGPPIYWGVVAVIAFGIAYARVKLKPIH